MDDRIERFLKVAMERFEAETPNPAVWQYLYDELKRCLEPEDAQILEDKWRALGRARARDKWDEHFLQAIEDESSMNMRIYASDNNGLNAWVKNPQTALVNNSPLLNAAKQQAKIAVGSGGGGGTGTTIMSQNPFLNAYQSTNGL